MQFKSDNMSSQKLSLYRENRHYHIYTWDKITKDPTHILVFHLKRGESYIQSSNKCVLFSPSRGRDYHIYIDEVKKYICTGCVVKGKCPLLHICEIEPRMRGVLWTPQYESILDVSIKQLTPRSIDGPNYENRTALFIAAMTGNATHVKHLTSIGIELDYQDKYGMTAVYAASASGNLECLICLVEAGACTNLATHRGLLPVDIAHMFGKTKCFNFLTETKLDDPPNLLDIDIGKVAVSTRVGAIVIVSAFPGHILATIAKEVCKMMKGVYINEDDISSTNVKEALNMKERLIFTSHTNYSTRVKRKFLNLANSYNYAIIGMVPQETTRDVSNSALGQLFVAAINEYYTIQRRCANDSFNTTQRFREALASLIRIDAMLNEKNWLNDLIIVPDLSQIYDDDPLFPAVGSMIKQLRQDKGYIEEPFIINDFWTLHLLFPNIRKTYKEVNNDALLDEIICKICPHMK